MKNFSKLILGLVLACIALPVLTGCHTAEGFGKDMEKAGEKIQDKTQ